MFIATFLTAALIAAPTDSRAAVEALAAEPRYTSEKIGYSGSRSPAYELFTRLLEVAGDDELRGLLGHASPVVRLYALEGLILRGFEPAPLLTELRDQEAWVDTQYGCMQERERVGAVAKQIAGSG